MRVKSLFTIIFIWLICDALEIWAYRSGEKVSNLTAYLFYLIGIGFSSYWLTYFLLWNFDCEQPESYPENADWVDEYLERIYKH